MSELEQDLSIRLKDKNIFSKDLNNAFHQVLIDPENVPKTAIITPFGLPIEFMRMPFGVRNAAQTFQRFIHTAFRYYIC